jgi:parallel beta-helix repeat protein
MHKNILTVVGITILFLGTCINPTVANDNVKKPTNPISSGNTLYVGGSGPGNHSTIQGAIDSADRNDTVFVYDYSSPYYENIEIRKEITVMGENKESTIIDGSGVDDVVYLRGSGAKITGFTIQNGGSEYGDSGMRIGGSDNIITGNIIKDNNFYGIEMWGKDIIISNNVIKNNKHFGMYIAYTSSGAKVFNNIFEEYDSICTYGGSEVGTLEIVNNTANGKPIRCYINMNDMVLPSDASEVILIDCNNCTVKNVDCSGLDIGVLIVGNSSNNHIFDCTIMDNTWAGVLISTYNGMNNNISNNVIADNYIGVYIIDSEYNTLFGNIIDGNEFGIWITPGILPTSTSTKQEHHPLDHPNRNTNICKNNITKNEWGIYLCYSSLNNIYLNNITKNEVGIYIEALYGGSNSNNVYLNNFMFNINGISISTSRNNIYQNNFIYNWNGMSIGFGFIYSVNNNTIYHNNFIHNRRNGLDLNQGSNNWDDGSEGNYWDNYRGRDWNGDGIGERPFRIIPFFIKNKDKYPLMEPYADVPDVTIKALYNIPRTRASSYHWLFERFPLLERLLTFALL